MVFILIYSITVSCAGLDGEGSNTTETIECKDRAYLDNCLKKLPPILEKSEMKGIPSSKKDLDTSCRLHTIRK